MGCLCHELSRVCLCYVYYDTDRPLTVIFRFVEFGSTPAFVGLWEFASTPPRRTALQQAYAQFVQLYAADLSLPAPYLRARLTSATNPDQLVQYIYTRDDNVFRLDITFPAGM